MRGVENFLTSRLRCVGWRFEQRATCCAIFVLILASLSIARSHDATSDVLVQAKSLSEARKFPDALKMLDAYTRANPRAKDAPAAFLLKGRCEELSKGAISAEGERTWEWLIRTYPDSDEAAQAFQNLIRFYASRSRPDMVEKTRQRLLRQFPGHPVVMETLLAEAKNLAAGGEHGKALAIYEKISEGLSPADRQQMELCRLAAAGDPESLFTAAQATFLANPLEAEGFYEAYLKKKGDPANLSQAKTRLGFCYSRSKDPQKIEKAEKLWKEVIARGPPSDEWVMESRWYSIQLLAGPKNQWREAIRELDAILRVSSRGAFRHEQALFTKAWLLWANKQWADAAKGFQLLVETYPAKATHGPIQFYLQDCLAKQG